MRWFEEQVLVHELALRNWIEVRFPDFESDDLIQEAFLRIWKVRRETDTEIDNPKGFLFATARNIVFSTVRRQRREEALGETTAQNVMDEGPCTPETIAREEEIEILTTAFKTLPERCREIFTLRRIRGLSQKEIAARMGISEKTVESQNVIGMRKLTHFFRQLDTEAAEKPSVQKVSLKPSPLGVSEFQHSVPHA